jgi:hypothetical protein
MTHAARAAQQEKPLDSSGFFVCAYACRATVLRWSSPVG